MDNITNNSKFYLILALCWMATLYVLSSVPQLADYNTFTGQDKIEHLLAFGVLGFLLMRTFELSLKKSVFYRVVLVSVLVASYGALDEFHQLFVPGRTASLADLAADAAGGFLGALLVCVLRFHATDKT